MASQSIGYTRRQIGRAKVTAQKALEGPDGALKAYAPDMLKQAEAYEAADAAAVAAERAANKEVGEGEAALAKLQSLFDQTRELVSAKLGITYERSSAFRTPDDFLKAAEDLESELSGIVTEQWVQAVLPGYSQALSEADKEYFEGNDARKAQQKGSLEREQVQGQVRPVLVTFRRLVRLQFGPSSREYRELLDRRSRSSNDDDPIDPSGNDPSS